MSVQVDVWLKLAIGAAIAYLASLAFEPYPLSFVLKMLPCLLLAVSCYFGLQGKPQWLMTAALSLSALADAAIEFSFLAGLLIFLCVQITYTVAFYSRAGLWHQRKTLLAILALFYFTALTVLVPKAEEMAIGVGIYMSAISMMVLFAIAYRGSLWVLVGATSFLVSDTLIGVNEFWTPFPQADLAIMTTYYAGQIMIVLGVIATENTPASKAI